MALSLYIKSVVYHMNNDNDLPQRRIVIGFNNESMLSAGLFTKHAMCVCVCVYLLIQEGVVDTLMANGC